MGCDKAWCVYLLRCADDSLYCGISNDLDARIATHNAGRGARYTRSRLPVVLVWHALCADRVAAAKQEWAIKQLSRDAKWALVRRGNPPAAQTAALPATG